MNDTSLEFPPYVVRHYPRDPERLIVVFTGMAQHTACAPFEEFRNSLAPLGASLCFVIDQTPGWFGHDATPGMLDHVVELAAGYPHVGVMGESMGGSGAIMFAGHCSNVQRFLAFAPQFSMANPFLQFDNRFHKVARRIPSQRYLSFDAPQRPAEGLILYGTQEWADLVHAGMYAVYGYELGFVDGAGHLVAIHLKTSARGNLLVELTAKFADFSAPFGYESARQVLGEALSRHVASRDNGFDGVTRFYVGARFATASPQRAPVPGGLTDLTEGRSTDQSSISQWSRGTTAEDSAGAIGGAPTGRFGFHTDVEEGPWWSIDFGEDVVVKLIRIYSRMDDMSVAYQGSRFAIEVPDGRSKWRAVFRKEDRTPFGGADGHPFSWAPEGGLTARNLRIRAAGRTAMHYDKIEIFG